MDHPDVLAHNLPGKTREGRADLREGSLVGLDLDAEL
jgi:hypothetical protein